MAKRLDRAAKVAASANTFAAIADGLLNQKRREGKAERTTSKIEWLLGLARPDLGGRPIAEITAAEVLRVLKKVEARGRLETATRLRATIGQVFRFAVAIGRADTGPTGALRGAIALGLDVRFGSHATDRLPVGLGTNAPFSERAQEKLGTV